MEGNVELLGRQIRYQKEGKGEALVMVHGLGGSLGEWGRVMESLGRDFTVYTFDLPGHGHSGGLGRSEANLSFGRLILEEFLKIFDLEKPTLLGGSMGGLIVLDYALSFPDRVKKLILVDSSGLGKEIAWFLKVTTIPVLGEIASRPTGKNVERMMGHMVVDISCISQDMLSRSCETRDRPGNQKALLKLLRHGVNLFGQKRKVRRTDSLPNLKVPTLILWGEKDQVVPVAHGTRASKLIPGAKLHIFPNTGHWPHVECPEEFSGIIRTFAST